MGLACLTMWHGRRHEGSETPCCERPDHGGMAYNKTGMRISPIDRWNVRLVVRALLLSLTCLFASAAVAGPGLPGMHEMESPHFHFFYDGSNLMDMERLQQTAEEDYGRLTGLFGFAPTERIPVVLYSNRADFRKASHFKRTELVVGTAGTADDVIRLDASKILESPARVIGHELAHVFVFKLLGSHVNALPLWMHEGLAQEAGGSSFQQAETDTVNALLAGAMLPLSSLVTKFPEGEQNGLAYDEAQAAVHGLLERGGWPRLRTLLERMRDGAAFDHAMQVVYGMDAAEWESAWVRSLQSGARVQYWIQVATWLVPVLMFVALTWGVIAVQRRRRRQIRDEEPVSEIEPPTWWREDEFRK